MLWPAVADGGRRGAPRHRRPTPAGARRRSRDRPAGPARRGGSSPGDGIDRREDAELVLHGLGHVQHHEVGEAWPGELRAHGKSTRRDRPARPPPGGRGGWPGAPAASATACCGLRRVSRCRRRGRTAAASTSVSAARPTCRRRHAQSRMTPCRSAKSSAQVEMSIGGYSMAAKSRKALESAPITSSSSGRMDRTSGRSSWTHSSMARSYVGGTASSTSWPASARASAARRTAAATPASVVPPGGSVHTAMRNRAPGSLVRRLTGRLSGSRGCAPASDLQTGADIGDAARHARPRPPSAGT